MLLQCLGRWLAVIMLSWPLPGSWAAEPIAVEVKAVPLDTATPERTTLGPLRYKGGIEIRSRDRRFGGLSGLTVSADGKRFVAVADVGFWFTGRLLYDGDGRLIGVADTEIAPFLDAAGRPLTGRKNTDAEAIADDGAGGFIVAFEQKHRLMRFARAGGRGQPFPAPPGVEAAPPNAGMEALTRLHDGRLLTVTEGLRTDDGAAVSGWLGPPPWQPLSVRTSGGFEPTALADLPDGALLVERRFPFLAIRLRRIAAGDLRQGARIDPAEIARFEGSLSYDNFEGVATRAGAGGETLVYLLSDDNQNVFQRTLLLHFALAVGD
ncbi:MAG: esterase-like activity of phytase family protein [Rhodospirillales bacterium]